MPDFAKLLDLTGPKALAIFIACVAIKIASIKGWIVLSDIHSSAAAVTDVVAIVSGALALIWMIEFAVNWIRGRGVRRRRRRQIREYLSSLSAEEEGLLRGMLADNEQSMNSNINDPIVNRLVQKGLLTRVGTGSILAFPHTVPPLVWEEMQMKWPQEWLTGQLDHH